MRSSMTVATLALLEASALVFPTGRTMTESAVILRAGSKTEESRSRRHVVIETAIGLAVAATGCTCNVAVAGEGSQDGRVVSASELLSFSRPPGSSTRRIVITGANSGVG